MDRHGLTVVVENDDLKEPACSVGTDVEISVALAHYADGVADCVLDVLVVNTVLTGVVRDLHPMQVILPTLAAQGNLPNLATWPEHAGELETSILLASDLDYLRDGWQTSDHTANDRRYLTSLGIHAYTPTGVIGSPSQATAAKGSNILDHLGRNADTLIGLLTTR